MGFFKSLMSTISPDAKTGTPFRLDNNQTVYYKGNGVTKLDAAHVAGYFKGYHDMMNAVLDAVNEGQLKDPIFDVQLLAATTNDPVQLGFIVGAKAVSEETIAYFKDAAASFQEEIFKGRTITIAQLDTNFQVISTL